MDHYALMDAALKGVMLLVFIYVVMLLLRALRWLWRYITGVSIDDVASTTGVAAGKVSGTARRLASSFKDGFNKAQD